MVTAKCISKNRDNKGVIVSYTLQDTTGQKMNVTGQQIKAAITAGQIDIVNLQIDKAGRLVDKAEPVTKEIELKQKKRVKIIKKCRAALDKNEVFSAEYNEETNYSEINSNMSVLYNNYNPLKLSESFVNIIGAIVDITEGWGQPFNNEPYNKTVYLLMVDSKTDDRTHNKSKCIFTTAIEKCKILKDFLGENYDIVAIKFETNSNRRFKEITYEIKGDYIRIK